MAGLRWHGVAIVALAMGACTNTFIDLTPDGGDSLGVDDGEPGADVADVADDGGDTVFRPPPLCGNGVVDPGEDCDDENRLEGDECTKDCLAGPGEPVPGPDPAAQPYVALASEDVLPSTLYPPVGGVGAAEQSLFPVTAGEGFSAATWARNPPDVGSPAQISTRFLRSDGSLVRDDVVIGLMSGWRVSLVAAAARLDDVLLVWQTRSNGLWRAVLSMAGGLAEAPAPLGSSLDARNPALASAGTGFMMAWYEGADLFPCIHDGTGPSQIYVRRLGPNGSTDGMGDSVVLEEPLAARTAAYLAPGDDDTVGMLWWRASTEPSGSCTLRFGVVDAGLTTIADGGVVGPGLSGRITAAEGSYRVAWRTTSTTGEQQLGFASFDSEAGLLAPPVLNDMPFGSFMGDVELAAGDHGLVAVVLGFDITTGLQLWFLRTDLLGRAVGLPAEVDPSCTRPACTFGPFNIVWGGDAFLVIYFVTLNLGEPTESTEMRMVRLVPEV